LQKIGILGGTFDPPHIGHLILAEYTLEALQLDKVLFLPAGVQPHKPETRSHVQHRLNMVQHAIADNPKFALSRVDIDRDPPHYTADTLPLLQQQYPDAQLYFLMGGDNLRSFPQWERPQAIIKKARLAVMRRSDEDITPTMHDDSIPNLSEHIDMVDTPLLSIWLSSTHIVERLKNGLGIRYIVPASVIAYIQANQLYLPEPS